MNKIKWLEDKYWCYMNRGKYWENTYKKPSSSKQSAYNNILNGIYDRLDGHNIYVVHNNCQAFSVGFEYYDSSGREHFVYITKSKIYDCLLDNDKYITKVDIL